MATLPRQSSEALSGLGAAVLDALPISLYVVDRDLRIVVWNSQRERGTLGRPRREVLGRPLQRVLSPMGFRATLPILKRVFASGNPHEETTETQGSRLYHIRRLPVVRGGQVSHVISWFEDITDQRAVEMRLIASDRLAYLGQLVAGVAHEVSNPLAGIAGCAEALASLALQAPTRASRREASEFRDLIRGEVARCERIVRSLLDAARPDPGMVCDLAGTVASSMRLLERHPAFARVRVVSRIPRDLWARIDPDSVKQVVMALAVNAARAMPAGGVLTLKGAKVRGDVVVDVMDTGPGVPAAVRPHIFEPFFTTDSTKGAGLGLAIARSLVRSRGGDLLYWPRPKVGGSFRIQLKAAEKSVSVTYRVLVAEDESTYGLTVGRFLQERGHEVKVCPTGKATIKSLTESEWDVLLLDLKLPDADGVEILAKVRKDHADLQTIIVTGFANVESAIDSMRLGAFDYLTKPPNFEELAVRVDKAGEKTILERENRRLRFQVQRGMSSEILTRSAALKKVIQTLEKVAAAKTPVLIEGESGAGKELLAQHLHRLSPRSSRAFVDLNCAAVPSTLLESELFGHERGAFTGAGNEKPGLVEVADGGTLFLDEVGEMAAEIQSKFLRVLDSGAFYRVGATRKRRADFRLVAATNRDLKAEVAAGRFRKDLYYRIHGVRVVIPPLRDRPEDIPLLVEHFSRLLPVPRRFSPAALKVLTAHDWPGNVRELHFAVERAGLLAEGEMIDVADLPPEIGEPSGRRTVAAPVLPPALEAGDLDDDELSSGDGIDVARVRTALEQARWRRGRAAQILGVSPRTLYRWMKRLGL